MCEERSRPLRVARHAPSIRVQVPEVHRHVVRHEDFEVAEARGDIAPLLSELDRGSETQGSTRILVIRNADTSFVSFSRQDGVFTAVPAEDRIGSPHDFSRSATLQRAQQVDLTDQGKHDGILGTAHLGILNSPETWGIAFEFLTGTSPRR